jgi:hypothetical protein
VIGTKPGYDYSKLDKHGMIKENTELNDKTVLIGMATSNSAASDVKVDASKTPKKGQLGIVDKTFITEGEEGTRIAKIRVREERIPNIGDKMASRAGQKGTIGLVVPERDMPFAANGIRPDLIINPHAIPSRMTIGQFVETITGKASAMYGAFGDCTAFNNDGSKIGVFGDLLCKSGYHSSGNEVLYNGMTGEQLEVEIFMGPNYYMRLKHMVKDKINYRALGPRTALTRQPVSGRANDGGLRIGEMERDGVISHGASAFLQESMMERGDKYKIAICNTTGMIAIYNPAKNLFMSPMADGPIRFTDNIDTSKMNIETVSKFGRSFSVIEVPYSFKLLVQELQAINVQMRIITEDNIDQIESMSFSGNLNALTKNKADTPNSLVQQIKQILSKGYVGNQMASFESIKSSNGTPDSIPFAPKSPDSIPFAPKSPDSIPFAPGSPVNLDNVYQPTDAEYQHLIESVNPNSPAYNFNSPYVPEKHGQPGSAVYNPNTPINSQPGSIVFPASPDYPPPGPGLGAGSSAGSSAEFYVGESVIFRGDSKPGRIWTVKNIGDKFITIDTRDNAGLDMSDTIKVVTQMDIYRPGDFAYSSPSIQPLYDEPMQLANANKPTEPTNMPAINIKIVNGNDMTEPSNTTQYQVDATNTTNGPVSAPGQALIKMKPQVPGDAPQPSAADNSLDFSKGMIIKKV